jgi:hypothetical protein
MTSDNHAVTVSVETAAHNALANCAQSIYDTYGLRIEQCQVEWRDVTQMTNTHKVLVVESVTATTTSFPQDPRYGT